MSQVSVVFLKKFVHGDSIFFFRNSEKKVENKQDFLEIEYDKMAQSLFN